MFFLGQSGFCRGVSGVKLPPYFGLWHWLSVLKGERPSWVFPGCSFIAHLWTQSSVSICLWGKEVFVLAQALLPTSDLDERLWFKFWRKLERSPCFLANTPLRAPTHVPPTICKVWAGQGASPQETGDSWRLCRSCEQLPCQREPIGRGWGR